MAINTSELDIVVQAKDEASAVFKSVESSIIRFVGAVSSLLTTFGAVTFPVKQASDLQAELINVAKTTNFTDDQIAQLRIGLINLSSQVDITTTDLAKIAATAGQLGLGKSGVEGISAFTATAARFASVVGISVDESAAGLARLGNIFKIGVKDTERIGSLLNEISNNSTASGRDLIDMIQRIGTAGDVLSVKQSAALAATARDLGLSLEVSGTSLQKLFLNLQTKADQIAPVIGKPVTEFVRILQTDGIKGLQLYLDTAAKMDSASRASFIQLTSGGGRVFDVVTKFANDAARGYEVLGKNMRSAEVGFEGGNSAIREQERVMQGFGKQMQVVINLLVNLSQAVGDTALSALTALAKEFQTFLKSDKTLDNVLQFGESIGNAAKYLYNFASILANLAKAMSPFLVVLEVFIGMKIAGIILGIADSIGKWEARMVGTARQFTNLVTGQTAIKVATNETVLAAERLEATHLAAAEAARISGATQLEQLRLIQIAQEATAASAAARAKVLGAEASLLGPTATAAGAAVGTRVAAGKLRDLGAEAASTTAAHAAAAALKEEEVAFAAMASASAAYSTQYTAARARMLALDAEIITQTALVTEAEAAYDNATKGTVRSKLAQLNMQRDILAGKVQDAELTAREVSQEAEHLLILEAEATATAAIARNKAAAAVATDAQLAGELTKGAAGLAAGTAAGAAAGAAAAAGLKGAAASAGGTALAEGLEIGVAAAAPGMLAKIGPKIAAFGMGLLKFLTGGWGLLLQLVVVPILLYFWDDISKMFKGIFGISGELAAKTDQDSRIRQRAVEAEALTVRNLADEYDRLAESTQFKTYKAGDLTDPSKRSEFGTNFGNTNSDITRIQAKISQVNTDLAQMELTEAAITQEISRANLAYANQVKMIELIKLDLSGDFNRETGPVYSEADLTKANALLATYRKRIDDLKLAQTGVAGQKDFARQQLPELDSQLYTRFKGLAPVFDKDTVALTREAAVVAGLAEEMKKLSADSSAVVEKVAKGGGDAAERTAAASAKVQMGILEGQYRAKKEALDKSILESSPTAARNIQLITPDVFNASKKQLETLAAGVAGFLDGTSADFEQNIQKDLSKVEKLRFELVALNTERVGINLGGGNPAEIDKQIAAKTAEMTVERNSIMQRRQAVDVTKQAAMTTEELTRQTRKNTVESITDVLQIAVRHRALTAVSQALLVLRDAAEREAKSYTAAWQQAATAATNAVRDGLQYIANFATAAANRQTGMKLALFDTDTTRLKASLDRAWSLYEQYRRRQMDLAGLTPEQRDQQEYVLQQQKQKYMEEVDQARQVERVRFEYDTNAKLAAAAAERLQKGAVEMQTAAAMQQEYQNRANAATDEGEKKRLQSIADAALKELKIKEAAANADEAQLKAAQAKMAELRDARVQGGVYTNPVQPIDSKAADEALTKINESLGTYAAQHLEILDKIKTAQTTNAQTAVRAYNEVEGKLKDVQAQAEKAAAAMGVSVETFLKKMGDAMAAQIPAIQSLVDKAGMIKNIEVGVDLGKLPEITKQFKKTMDDSNSEISTGLDKIANTMADKGWGKSQSELLKNLKIEYNIEANATEIKKAQDDIKEKVEKQNLILRGVTFGGVPEALQKAIDNDGKAYTASVAIKGAGEAPQAKAGGGMIYGPGTGTSDSILARVSHGEYVNDAQTVSTFGSGFFATLKSISRFGGPAVVNFLRNFGGVSLPAFAGGGYVDMGSLSGGAAGGATGSMDTVRVELAVGGKQVTLFTEREQAKALTKVLKNLSRSVS